MESLDRALPPSSARRRIGVAKPESTLEATGSSLTAGYGSRPVEGREGNEPEAVEMKTFPAKEEFVKETQEMGKELPQETLEQKQEKIEAFKKEANELMSQIKEEERADAANDEYKRLETISATFGDNYTEDETRWVGMKDLDALKTEMDLHNWMEFVAKLKGATQEDLNKNTELTETGKRFGRLYQSVDNAIFSYERHSGEQARDKAARRERLRQTINPLM